MGILSLDTMGTLALLVIAGMQLLLGISLIVFMAGAGSKLRGLAGDMQDALHGMQRALQSVEELGNELKQRGFVEKAISAMESAEGAVGKIDPLAADFRETLADARTLLDDVTQTSQSVRARVEDLAAMQSEITALSGTLRDVIGELRDRELATKLANVLSDTSLLAADIGILAENANSYLERGRPLVRSISGVVDNARQRAAGISSVLGRVREGIRAGVETWKEQDSTPE